MSSSTPRGKSLERMNALHHHAQTEQRSYSSSRNASQQDDSSYSATDDSDDDNLPLASKGRVALITRMAITRATQQSRPRGNVPTSSRSRANKIPPGSKFSRPLPSIRKGGTSDKTNNKKKTNSKKRDKDDHLDCNEPNRTEMVNDGSGVGGATMAAKINNNDLEKIQDNEQPSDGVMGDKADDEGVSMNVVTGNNSNKKRRSNRKKKDNAEGLGGNEIIVMDEGTGGDYANRKTTANAKGLGCNDVHAAMDVGNCGIDAPVNIFSIFTDEEVDGINQGSADDHIVNDTSITVIDTESKKEIVLVSKDVLKKMIQLLIKEGMSDNHPVHLLRNLVPYEEYLLQLAGQLDNKMSYVDERMQTTTITNLVKRTFESFGVSVEGKFECTEDEMFLDVVRVWQLIHALNVNSVAFGNFLPTSEVVEPFYHRLKPLFEKAIASGKRSKTHKSNSSKTSEKINNDTKEVSHHNDSKRSVVIDGKPFKCNGVKVKGDSVKTYTKYFQCNMVLDQSDGSKWKPHNEVAKRAGKNVYPHQLVKCEGTMLGIFTTKNGKQTQQFQPGSKPHICYNRSVAHGVPMETRIPMILIVSSSSWNIDRHAIDSMKTALSNVSKKWWVNQANCGSKRQYLKELSSEKSLEMVRKQAESFVEKYMRNFVSKMYPSLTHCKVGALRSRGDQSQFDLQGTLHRDYLDDVDKKIPEERPQSIIIALDPFVLLYENDSDYHDDSVGSQSVAKGEAVLFTSSLRHAGGSNGTKEDKTWKYRLFAYIVSELSDFPSEVTRLNLN